MIYSPDLLCNWICSVHHMTRHWTSQLQLALKRCPVVTNFSKQELYVYELLNCDYFLTDLALRQTLPFYDRVLHWLRLSIIESEIWKSISWFKALSDCFLMDSHLDAIIGVTLITECEGRLWLIEIQRFLSKIYLLSSFRHYFQILAQI